MPFIFLNVTTAKNPKSVTVQPVLDRITGLTGNFFHPVDLSVYILDLRLQILLQFLNHDKM